MAAKKIEKIRVEIETELERHPGILEAAVVAKSDRHGEYSFHAFIAGQPDRPLRESDLRAHLAANASQLTNLFFLPRLPRTASGEKDFSRLQVPEEDIAAATGPELKADQRRLAALFARVLGVASVGPDDHFFDHGGTSLSAHRLIMEISDEFQVQIPITTLRQKGSVRDLITVIRAESPSTHARTTIVVSPELRFEPFPLTDTQGAYFAHGCGHRLIEIDVPALDSRRLQNAWQTLIERHDMLRAVIHQDGTQQVRPEAPLFGPTMVDLTRADSATTERVLRETRERVSHRTREPGAWPLFDLVIHCFPQNFARVHLAVDAMICDERSFRILVWELGQLYLRPDLQLPPLSLTFRDVCAARFTPEATQSARAYWEKRLPTLPPAPKLPMTKQAGAEFERTWARRQFALSPDRWQKFKTRCAQNHVTPSSVLATAYAEIIGLWSGSSRFTLNLPTFRRPHWHAEIDALVGEFTSPQLLGVDLTDGHTFVDRARRLQERLWQDLEQDGVNGIHLLRQLARQRPDEAMLGLMPIVFSSWLDFPELTAPLGGRCAYRLTKTPLVHLDHQVHEEDGQLHLTWDAAEDLFPPGLIEDMFASYELLVKRLATDPETWTSDDVVRLPESQRRLFSSTNATRTPISDQTLFELFSQQCRKTPDRPALITTERAFTYAELMRLSHGIAEALRAADIQASEIVAIVMQKGWEQIAAVLGVLQAGCVYVPLDADIPNARIDQIVKSSGASAVLTQDACLERVKAATSAKTLVVNAHISALDLDPNSVRAAHPEDLAYIIYTSGTNGTPNGVAIDHRGAVNTVLDVNERFRISAEDRVLALSAFSVGLSVYDIFGTLAAGAAIVLPDSAHFREPEHWLQLIARERVTVWNSVPELMQQLVDDANAAKLSTSQLRLVLMSGDWIPINLPDRIRERIASVEVISLGGATEASTWSILFPIGKRDPSWRSIPYGKPMRNQTVHVLDERLRPCPVWVTGHLHIGGIGVAQCYWNDDQKTRRSFVMHPRTGQRMYRTNDYGRYLPDGNIEFSGRLDSQVKIRGYRIECGEIEAVLEKGQELSQFAVIAKSDGRDGRQLIACVVGKTARPPEDLITRLRAHLRAHLPDYMLPAKFLVMDQMPLTGNGKVDRSALAAMLESEASDSVPRDAESRTEQILQYLWGTELGLPKIGIDENLFDLGCTSLKIVHVQRQLREEHRLSVPLHGFFQHPTIRKLAARIDEAREEYSTDSARVTPIVRAATRGKWIHGTQPDSHAALRLFCFHHAGGSARAFQKWPAALGETIEVCPIQLPGRVERLVEPPQTDLNSLVSGVVEAMTPWLDRPFAFVGSSFGATLAFEVARQLRTNGAPRPEHFIAIAARPPSSPPRQPLLHKLNDRDFLRLLNQRLGGAVPAELMSNEELQRIALPCLRADIEAIETYRYRPGKALDFPITVFKGDQDPSVSVEELKSWGMETMGFRLQSYHGPHLLPDTFEEAAALKLFAELILGFANGIRKAG